MKNETDELNKAIIELQEKRIQQLESLKEDLITPYDSVDPKKLYTGTFKEVSSSSSRIKNSIIGFAIGVGTGFLMKKLWIGKSKSGIKRLLGTFIHFAVANVVSNRAGGIISTGENLLDGLFKRKKRSKNRIPHNGEDLPLY